MYAGARDPAGASVKGLQALEVTYPGRLEVVKLVSADVEGNKAMAKHIEGRHGRLDTVIANAGERCITLLGKEYLTYADT